MTTNQKTELSREIRLWCTQVVIPAFTIVGLGVVALKDKIFKTKENVVEFRKENK